MEQAPEFYTVEQIAQKLQVSEDTVTNFLKRKKNRLKGYKVGRQWRVRIEDYEEWLRNQQYSDEEES